MPNIEQLLKVNKFHTENYQLYIDRGIDYLAKTKISFACLVRDIENRIDSNITKVHNFAKKYCQEYNIIFFENDSTDNTVSKLEQIKLQYTNVDFISKKYNRAKFGSVKIPARTIALSEYRNELNRFIKTNYNNDYIIVLDFDFADFSENGILNSFGYFASNKEYSGIVGNSFSIQTLFGMSDQLWNYDSWAYRGSWWEDITQNPTINHIDPMGWFGLWIPPVGSKPFQVNSAFGGCGIYKSNYYHEGIYSGPDCEHVLFHYSLYNKYTDFKLFLNPSQVMLF